MTKFKKILLGSASLVLVAAAWAADLGASKSAGLVGEREDGYVGYVNTVPADVQTMVQNINNQRRAEYERIAATNNLSRQQVEALAGKKAIDKTASGEYVFIGGQWQRKP
ncbi:MAG: YdbL family protein [Pseudomonadales bacterium]|nr:YdbL family protein [Pseudomonadales bacterium]